MLTHTIVVLDSSGSMEPLTRDTIGGYNRYLKEQQSVALEGDTWTLTVFSNASTVALRSVPVKRVPRLSPETYRPNGGTALLDAIADAVQAVTLNGDDRALCVVMTDGEENASERTTPKQLRALVQDRERSGQWTFVFLGAGIDAFTTAQQAGSASLNMLSYAPTSGGTKEAWRRLSRASTSYNVSRVAPADAAPFFEDDDSGAPKKSRK